MLGLPGAAPNVTTLGKCLKVQVPPRSSFGSLSELPHHGHICLQCQLSQLERFHSPSSFFHPHSPLHAPLIQTHLPFSPFPYPFAPEVSVLLSLPAELLISHSWQQEWSWQRPKLILLKPPQIIALKTNWGGFIEDLRHEDPVGSPAGDKGVLVDRGRHIQINFGRRLKGIASHGH